MTRGGVNALETILDCTKAVAATRLEWDCSTVSLAPVTTDQTCTCNDMVTTG